MAPSSQELEPPQNPGRFKSVNLAIQKDRGAQAQALGITRLPSLVVDGRVMRLDDHSPIDHYV
jgi:hypothetical protein